MTTERKTINWKDVLGNPYNRKIHPLMNREGGLVLPQKVGIRGGTKSSELTDMVNVVYDRDYIISKLANQLKPLIGFKWNEIQSLTSEAFKQLKESD